MQAAQPAEQDVLVIAQAVLGMAFLERRNQPIDQAAFRQQDQGRDALGDLGRGVVQQVERVPVGLDAGGQSRCCSRSRLAELVAFDQLELLVETLMRAGLTLECSGSGEGLRGDSGDADPVPGGRRQLDGFDEQLAELGAKVLVAFRGA